MNGNSRRWWTIALLLAWAGAIFATSSTVMTQRRLFGIAGSVLGPVNLDRFKVFWGMSWFVIVKGWHATEFAILTALLIWALNTRWPAARQRNILLAAACALLFAASDEFHQTFVPTRGGTLWDVLIDALGIGAATLIGLRRARLQSSESESGL